MKNSLLSIASAAILAIVWHTATGASSDVDRANAHAIAVNTDVNNTEPLPDFDGDGTVGFGDFVKFAAKFGLSRDDEGYDRQYDLDGDGIIGFSDFLIFASSFGSEAPSPVVSIPDANLRAAIETALEKASGAPITEAEVKRLTQLTARNARITDLTGLQFANNLTRLDLGNSYVIGEGFSNRNEISELSPLAELKNLTDLILDDNKISDITPLSGLTKLNRLNLRSNRNINGISGLAGLTDLVLLNLRFTDISDITPLAGLSNLTWLDLNFNNITDITPLANLTNLTLLRLGDNNITDITPLTELTNLTFLTIGFNNINDKSMLAAVLANLTKLTILSLNDSEITDISMLAGLTNLEELVLLSNEITDISPLAGLTNLTELQLANNVITDISPLAGLTDLYDLSLEGNYISDIRPFAGLTNLTRLDLNKNNITDISPLAGLTDLTWLDLRFNNIKEVPGLAGLTNLTWLGLRGNPLNPSTSNGHIRVLEGRGTTVQYDSFQEKGDYDIELVFLDSFSDRDRRVLRWAARRWMAVVRDDLPDYEFSQGWSGPCGDHSIDIPPGERIDDLRIYVISIEDGPLGWGGPDVLRENSHLPLVGCMAFDVARSNLPIIGLHEIGHVLGFGTIWGRLGYYQNPPNGDQHFNGPLAIDAFDDAGGRGYTGAKVPVTGGHWRTSVFGQELMTYGGDLSAITIQSLADLGYSVDVTQADPYTLLNPRASAKIVPAQFSNYRPDANIVRTGAHIPGSQNAHERGWNTGAMRTIPGHDRLGVTLESAEGIGYPVADFGDNSLAARLHSFPGAEPETTCGAGVSREPIYVVDSKGRIIHTIDR